MAFRRRHYVTGGGPSAWSAYRNRVFPCLIKVSAGLLHDKYQTCPQVETRFYCLAQVPVVQLTGEYSTAVMAFITHINSRRGPRFFFMNICQRLGMDYTLAIHRTPRTHCCAAFLTFIAANNTLAFSTLILTSPRVRRQYCGSAVLASIRQCCADIAVAVPRHSL